jgi:hypothetical protein
MAGSTPTVSYKYYINLFLVISTWTGHVGSLLRLSSRLVEGLVKQRDKYSAEEAGSC